MSGRRYAAAALTSITAWGRGSRFPPRRGRDRLRRHHGFLAFRFGVAGVYFAILTIAFANCAIGFDHFRWVGGSSGFSCRSPTIRATISGTCADPAMFYYVMLALTVAAFALCHLCSRAGWGITGWRSARTRLRRARSVSTRIRYKMYAVVISAGMTAVAGVFFAFYYNNLFPERSFTSRARSS